jgi:hypothetical protein
MVKRFPLEALVWLTGLTALFFLDTDSKHLSLCLLKNAGIGFCPGCGLGTSISLFLNGHFYQSLSAHPLGIFAVIMLSFRIANLTKQYTQNYGKSY